VNRAVGKLFELTQVGTVYRCESLDVRMGRYTLVNVRNPKDRLSVRDKDLTRLFRQLEKV
jgi:hypothetical protein